MNGLGMGALEFQMMMDLMPLKRDMDKARDMVGGGLGGIKSMITGALGGLVAGLSVAAFGAWIKSAIDAGDATKEFSQKTGIAAKDVAGLQLAFKQGGVDSDALAKGLGKLSREMVDGNKAFDDLGIKTRNADGSMRSVKDVLYETTDALKATGNEAVRNKLAFEIFGKTYEGFVPTLEEGSEGLRKMADMAERLGLVIDQDTADAADQFNDTVELIGMSGQGVSRQIMAELLPTLNSLAGSFLDNVASGDNLAKMAEIIGAGLKGLFTVGAIGVEVFNTLGKTIGGVAAAVLSVAQGEFSQAKKILEETGRDTMNGWADTGKTIADVWTGAGATTTAQAAAMVKATRDVTVGTKDQTAALKKQADEQAKLTKAGDEYLLHVDAQLIATQRELALGRQLTDSEKALLKLEEDLKKGKLQLTQAGLNHAKAALMENEALRAGMALKRELAKLEAEAVLKRLDDTAALGDQVRAALEHNATIGATAEQLRILERVRLGDALATAEQALQAGIAKGARDGELEGLTLMVEELRKLKAAKEQGWAKDIGLEAAAAAKDAADEWKKTTDSIGQGLTDSLFRAFEAGRGFWDTLWSGITNLFKTTVLRMAIQPVQNGINGVVNGAANAAISGYGNGGGIGGAASSVYQYGSGLFGGSAYGAGTMTMGQSAAYGGAAAEMAGAEGAGAAAGGTSMAAYAGYAALIYAAVKQGEADYAKGHNRAQAEQGESALIGGNAGEFTPTAFTAWWMDKLGMNEKWTSILSGSTMVARGMSDLGLIRTHHAGSVVGIDGTGAASTLYGDSSTITDHYSGGIDDALRLMGGTSTSIVRDISKLFGNDGVITAIAKFAADGDTASIGQFMLQAGGQQVGYVGNGTDFAKYGTDANAAMDAFANDVAGATRDALETLDLPEWARETLAGLTDATTFADVQKAADYIASFQGAINALQRDLQPLGGIFTSIAGLSSDAMNELAGFAGGLDAFAQKAGAFVSTYYSQGEQAGIGAKAVLDQLTALGIDGSGMQSLADMRTLVEAQQINDTAGREQLAGLLDVAQSYASVGKVLEEQKLTLAELAAQAPQVAVLEAMRTPTEVTADATVRTATAAETQVDRLTTLQQSVEAGLAAVTAATDRLTSLMSGWDNGVGMTVVVETP